MIHKFTLEGVPIFGCPECKRCYYDEQQAYKCEYQDKMRGYIE